MSESETPNNAAAPLKSQPLNPKEGPESKLEAQLDKAASLIDMMVGKATSLMRDKNNLQRMMRLRESAFRLKRGRRWFPQSFRQYADAVSEVEKELRETSVNIRYAIDFYTIEYRRFGVALIAAIEDLGIDAMPIKKLISRSPMIAAKNTYRVLCRYLCEIDVIRVSGKTNDSRLVSELLTGIWPAKQGGSGSTKRKKYRYAEKHLTERQIEVLSVVGKYQENMTRAGLDLGISRQAVSEAYRAALKKLGQKMLPKPKTEQLRTDPRGNTAVATAEGPKSSKERIVFDRRVG